MASHSSTLAWRIPWMEEPGKVQSMGLQKATWLSNFTSHEAGSLPLLAARSPDSTFHLIRVKTGLAIHMHRALSTTVFAPQTVQSLYTRVSYTALNAGKRIILKLHIQVICQNQYIPPVKPGLQPLTSKEEMHCLICLSIMTDLYHYLSLLKGICSLPLPTGKSSSSPVSLN